MYEYTCYKTYYNYLVAILAYDLAILHISTHDDLITAAITEGDTC